MIKTLIQKLLYEEFAEDGKKILDGSLCFTTTNKKDVQKVYRILHRFDLRWRSGRSLLDEVNLELYFNESIQKTKVFCIIIDIYYSGDENDNDIIACNTYHTISKHDIPLDVNDFCRRMKKVRKRLKTSVDI